MSRSSKERTERRVREAAAKLTSPPRRKPSKARSPQYDARLLRAFIVTLTRLGNLERIALSDPRLAASPKLIKLVSRARLDIQAAVALAKELTR